MRNPIRENALKYGMAVTQHDLFKVMAVALMTIDHLGFFFDEDNLWWRVIGRWCVPIWFFLAGYARPSSTPRDVWWLAGLMIAADLILVSPIFPLNILVTILIARWLITRIESYDKDLFMVAMFTACCLALLPLTFKFFEYGTQVFLFTLAGFYRRALPGHWLGAVTLIVATILFMIVQHASFGMTPVQGGVMAIGMIPIIWGLHHFQRQTHPRYSDVPALSPLIRYTGRNTHYYYAVHYVLFLGIATALNPPKSWQVIWFAI